jgi:hypothetical protein
LPTARRYPETNPTTNSVRYDRSCAGTTGAAPDRGPTGFSLASQRGIPVPQAPLGAPMGHLRRRPSTRRDVVPTSRYVSLPRDVGLLRDPRPSEGVRTEPRNPSGFWASTLRSGSPRSLLVGAWVLLQRTQAPPRSSLGVARGDSDPEDLAPFASASPKLLGRLLRRTSEL